MFALGPLLGMIRGSVRKCLVLRYSQYFPVASLFQNEGHLTIEKVTYNPRKGHLEKHGGKYTYCNFLPLSKFLALCVAGETTLEAHVWSLLRSKWRENGCKLRMLGKM